MFITYYRLYYLGKSISIKLTVTVDINIELNEFFILFWELMVMWRELSLIIYFPVFCQKKEKRKTKKKQNKRRRRVIIQFQGMNHLTKS